MKKLIPVLILGAFLTSLDANANAGAIVVTTGILVSGLKTSTGIHSHSFNRAKPTPDYYNYSRQDLSLLQPFPKSWRYLNLNDGEIVCVNDLNQVAFRHFNTRTPEILPDESGSPMKCRKEIDDK